MEAPQAWARRRLRSGIGWRARRAHGSRDP
jgi:hypothetical protein